MTAASSLAGARYPLAANLLDSVEALTDELIIRITDADSSYADPGLLTVEELREACLHNLTEIIRALTGAQPPLLRPARAVGRLKAERGIPIAALLHAYRVGGRLIWEWLTERSSGPGDPQLHELATTLWELIDTFSDAAVEAYRDTEILLVHADAQSQNRLIRSLFDDNSSNPVRVLTALRTLGLPEKGPFAVVVIEPADPGAALPGNLVHALKDIGVHSVWDAQIDAHAGLLAFSAQSALERATARLPELVAGRIGLSASFVSYTAIPAAVVEARIAAQSVRQGSRTALRFGADPVAHLLVALPDAGRRAATQILGPVLRLPDVERVELLAVLEAWYRCGGSAAAVADLLHCHRNTVRYRLRKIRDLTGRDTADPAQSADLHLALQAVALLGAAPTGTGESA
ncbi:PucR family transcriptional regulator [Skermania sp. ID1734]|uniref:PucR family transcriptional regulator n=1 Tax=Skermania sp. ID1734 TaxID=2597516 RepID=UPI00118170A9|nr:PucR family transcriptional regulator [Skermania sp. ID1734]TSD99666.1 PucR family transcriptional regulator [Skermania sp. ID1734]